MPPTDNQRDAGRPFLESYYLVDRRRNGREHESFLRECIGRAVSVMEGLGLDVDPRAVSVGDMIRAYKALPDFEQCFDWEMYEDGIFDLSLFEGYLEAYGNYAGAAARMSSLACGGEDWISEAQMRELLSADMNALQRLLVCLQMTGVTLSEAIGLGLHDVFLEEDGPYLRVRNSGDYKDAREVPLDPPW